MNDALSKARSGLKSLKTGSLDMQGLNKSFINIYMSQYKYFKSGIIYVQN